MSDSQIKVSITATDEGFTATTAAAKAAIQQWAAAVNQSGSSASSAAVDYQALINATTGVSNATRSAAESAEVFRKALGDATNETKSLRAAMDDTSGAITSGMGKAAGATSGVTRELIVLGHEAMQGRFSRIPGSLVVLTEMLGKASLAVTGLIGGFALAAIAAERLYTFMSRIDALKVGVQTAGAMFNPNLDEGKLTSMALAYRKLTDVSTEDSEKVVATYARMKGATEQTIQALIDQTQNFARATGESLPAAAGHIKEAFEAPTANGSRFLADMNASSDAVAQFNAISGDNAAAQRRVFLLEQLDAATKRVAASTNLSNKQKMEDLLEAAPTTGYNPIAGNDFGITDQFDAADRIAKERSAKLTADVKNAIGNMSNDEKLEPKQAPTWFEKQVEGADELKAKVSSSATDFKQMQADQATQLAEYWKNATALAQAGSKDQIRAHEEYLKYQEQADSQGLRGGTTWFEKEQAGAEELRAKIAGTASDYKSARADEAKALVSYWHDAEQQAQTGSKDQLRAHEQYLRAKEQADLGDLKIGEANAKSGLEAQIASLTAQQKAQSNNQQVVMDLENRKLDLLRASYGEDSRQYQEELGRKAELDRKYADQAVRIEEERLSTKQRVDAEILSSRTKTANAEVASNTKSKDEAIAELRQLEQEHASIELQMVADLMKSLTDGTVAYQKAADQRLQIEQRLAGQLAALDAQKETADAKATQKTLAAYSNTFDNIAKEGTTTFVGLIEKTTTWQQAEARIANTVINDFVSIAVRSLATWTATELAKTNITTANAVARAQAEGGTGFGALIATQVSQWLGLETTKTSITTTQAAARTATTTAAAATQQSTQLAADVSTKAESSVNAFGQINAAAGVAGANTYAAISAIPVVGPGLAPAAAAGAVTAVESFQGLVALDVGAYNVPKDMPAYIHAGEMVVPADFASGLRSGGLAAGSSTANSLTYSPTINAGGSGASMTDIERMVSKNSKQMYDYMYQMSRNGNLALPGRGI